MNLKRIEKKLTKLAESVAKGRMKKPSQIERRIGDLLGKNSRAAKSFEVELQNEDGQLRLKWHVRKDWEEWAKLSEGCYLLRTNLVGWDPARLWKTYIQLTDAEAAFRTLKSDLGIRPIWHQKQERVQAHILVCFLGYVLWKTLGQWMQRLGLGTNPRTLLKELEALKAVDVLLHTQEGQEIRLSCIAEPEPPLADLLARLGMVPPKRLRPAGLDQVEVKM